jgi:type II secretory pathway predicted ATPase ExeA
MTIDRLRAYFGFTKMPFSKELAPGMLHRSTTHAEAVARLSWLIAERALGVLTGEVGAGKTVAVRAATASLDPSRHTVIYLSQPGTGVRGIYAEVVRALGGQPCFQRSNLVPQAAELIEREESERGKTVTVVADEAQLYSPDQLESLRLLGNARMDSHSPFALVLVGQPTLRRRLRLGSFAALDQRIGLRYHLDGMSAAETADYIRHHLGLAGRTDTLFSDDAVSLIQQTSRGLPRAVNNLALSALVATYAANKAIVDESSARQAVTEVTAE